MPHNLFNTLQSFTPTSGTKGQFYSLPQLEKEGVGPVSKLPVSIRIVLESVLRNFDGNKITEDDVRAIANWKANDERTEEVPFVVARVLLQDFTGVPLLVDLAAMRSAVTRLEQESGDYRTARAGRSRHRSFGAGGLLEHGRRVPQKHGDGVQAEQLALSVSEVGHAGV